MTGVQTCALPICIVPPLEGLVGLLRVEVAQQSLLANLAASVVRDLTGFAVGASIGVAGGALLGLSPWRSRKRDILARELENCLSEQGPPWIEAAESLSGCERQLSGLAYSKLPFRHRPTLVICALVAKDRLGSTPAVRAGPTPGAIATLCGSPWRPPGGRDVPRTSHASIAGDRPSMWEIRDKQVRAVAG